MYYQNCLNNRHVADVLAYHLFDEKKEKYMKKEITEKKFSLTIISHLIKLGMILFLLFGNFVAADTQITAKSKDKNTAKYQGTVSGEWSGGTMGVNVEGTFSLSISADGTITGTFSGFESGNITGTLSPSGEINAKGSAGFSDWSGQLSIEDGRLSGSGTWEGYGSTGSWKSK
jgi:hypothetical protein